MSDIAEKVEGNAESSAVVEDLQHLAIKLAALQEERQQLLTKQSKLEASLPQIPNYDAKLFASVDDVFTLLKKHKVLDAEDSLVDARYFIKIFGLKGQGQVKETAGRGRGKALYLRPQVIEAINKVLELKK